MPLTPTLPAQRCRAAIKARLSNATSGFNPFLAACVAGAAIPAFAIDFTNDSLTFLQGKYSIASIEASAEMDFPLMAVYMGPSKAMLQQGNALVGQVFSGEIDYGLDVFLASADGQTQSQFDLLVSCTHDAVMNTLNDFTGIPDWAGQRVVYNGQAVMGQPTREYDEKQGRYFSQLPFVLRVFSPQ